MINKFFVGLLLCISIVGVRATGDLQGHESVDTDDLQGHRSVNSRDLPEISSFFQNSESCQELDSEGNTPLHKALKYRGFEELDFEIVKLILERSGGASVNTQNVYLEAPVHLAVQIRNVDLACRVIRLLHQYGADLEVENKFGVTPFRLVFARSEFKIRGFVAIHDSSICKLVKCFIDLGANKEAKIGDHTLFDYYINDCPKCRKYCSSQDIKCRGHYSDQGNSSNWAKYLLSGSLLGITGFCLFKYLKSDYCPRSLKQFFKSKSKRKLY